MPSQQLPASAGFHAGELRVQERAGVRLQARRLEGMLEQADLRGGMSRFLADRTYAVLTARDAEGRLWISPLTGPPGFLVVDGPASLLVRAAPAPGDPLHGLPPGQPAGLLAIEYRTRRRVRVNGTLHVAADGGMEMAVAEAYGNCPQYIPRHSLGAGPTPPAGGSRPPEPRTSLTPDDLALIEHAGTFMLGTTHPDRGNDASHRGGPAGFVRVEAGAVGCAGGPATARLTWPDYSGNNMFNSLGNLAVNPEAAAFFADFRTGATLHLTGRAETLWPAHAPRPRDDATGAERAVALDVQLAVTGPRLPLVDTDG